MYDCVVVQPYSTQPLEPNSDGELDEETDVSDEEGIIIDDWDAGLGK